tara:strand:+ start:1722 stop:3617 length:1896 start_codon:yes stop_codon:yes gene_type:complete
MNSLILIVQRLSKLPRISKIFMLIILDLLLNFFSTLIAFIIILDYEHQIIPYISNPSREHFIVFILFATIHLLFFSIFKNYRFINRHLNISFLIHISKSILSIMIVMLLILHTYKFYGVPRSLGLIQPILFFLLLVISRLFIKNIFTINQNNAKNILIYGAGEAGVQCYESMQTNKSFNTIAFIDDDKKKYGLKINNIEIISPLKISEYIKKYRINLVLICIPSLNIIERRQIIEKISNFDVSVKTLPSIDNIIDKNVSYLGLQDLDLDDLLDRKIDIDLSGLNSDLYSNNVLITGAGGSIGSEITKQVISYNPKTIVLLDNSEFNLYKITNTLEKIIKNQNKKVKIISKLTSIIDEKRVEYIFKNFTPEIIFHAAAYKHLPIVEENIIEAITNNVNGTLNILNNAKKFGSKKFILISTDKAVRSTSIMGSTKRLAEMCIQAYAEEEKKGVNGLALSMVRFGNVLNSSGSIVPLFRSQINEGGPITITHPDVTRYFMTIPEAVSLVIYSGSISIGGEVFVLNMGRPVKIVDLARRMLSLSGLTEFTKNNQSGDIELKYIGLRKGEKIHEELLYDKEATRVNNNIMVANENFIKLPKLLKILENINYCIKHNDEKGILSILKEFVSKNIEKD